MTKTPTRLSVTSEPSVPPPQKNMKYSLQNDNFCLFINKGSSWVWMLWSVVTRLVKHVSVNPTVLNVHVSLIKEWLITGSYQGWYSYLISTLFITWALEHGGMDLSGPNIILEVLIIGYSLLLSTKREFYF